MYVNIKLSQFVWNIFWGKGVDLKPQNCKKKKHVKMTKNIINIYYF